MINVEATVLSQFANSPSIMQLIKNLNTYLDPRTNIDDFYNLMWNVDTAVGYGLDVWGRIVGVNRVLQLASSTYFGFQGPTSASGVPWNQGIFYNGQNLTTNFSLLDGPFRVLILAKALANICNATIPSINQILINLFGPSGLMPIPGNSYCTSGGDMTMTYTFSSPLDPVSKAIVFQSGVLPTPCGIVASIVDP